MGAEAGGSSPFGVPVRDGEAQGGQSRDKGSKLELRVVGSAERWDIGNCEPSLVARGRFSMIKMDVDRTTLTPTIKPFSQEADPQEIRRQQEMQRRQDREEADDLRKLLEDVRELKREGVEDWQERMRPIETEGGMQEE